MNKKVSNVIFSIFMLLLIVGIIIGVVWLVKNWETLSTQTDLYSYEDLVEYGDEKYQEGLEASDNYKILYEETLKSLNQAEDRVNDLTEDLQDAINSGNVDKETIAGLQQDLAEAQADLIAKQEQIEELNNTITFYEKLLEAYENSDKLIVTFMLVDNGKEIPYDVQAVEPSAYLSAVMTPEKDDFEGWSLTKGGELINDLTTIQVTENMTIYGMCTNTVTFMVNGEEYATQEVSYGKYATDDEVSLTGYTLEGWSLIENGETITFNTTPIIKDTTFYAQCSKKNISFEPYSWNGLTEFFGDYVWTDGQNVYYSFGPEQYVLNKETSTWEEKNWSEYIPNLSGIDMWTDGQNLYGVDGYIFDNKLCYNHYVLNKSTSTWEQTVFYGLDNASSFSGINIWTDGQNVYYSYGPSEQYVLNKETSTWEAKIWNGFTDFAGSDVWTDGQNIYCSESKDNQYVLNKETSTWEEKNWIFEKDRFYIYGVWTDGQDIFSFSNTINGTECYVLEKQTSTWKFLLTLNLENMDYAFSPEYIWSDGTNYFYSQQSDQFILKI